MGPEGDADAGRVRVGSPAGRWVLFATILASGMGFLDATVVNVALPAIGRELDATVSGLQWTVNGYLLTLSALILLGGSLGDRLGRRRVFTAGVVWFAVASLLCAVAPDIDVLIAARILQGAGAALLTPGSLAIIEASFAREERSRAIGTWAALSGVAAAAGPLLGGYLVDAASWRWVFLINLPLAAAVLYATRTHVPESRDPTIAGRLDLPGSVLATLGLGGVTFALIEAPEDRIATAGIVAAAVAGLVLLVAFVLVERRSRSPMLPLHVFASGQFSAANLLTFAVYAGLGGVFFLLIVFLQTVLGYSPLEAGAASLPITALMLLLSGRAGALAQRSGPRPLLTAGPLLLAAGMALMVRLEPGSEYVSGVLPAVAVFGLGLSATVAPVTATALAAVDDSHAGVASAVNNAVSRVAQLLAIALLPTIAGLSGADYQDPQAFTDGFHTAMLVTAALAALGGVIAFLTIANDVLEDVPSEDDRARPAAERVARAGRRRLAPSRTYCPIDAAPLDRPRARERA